jgi:hypothetical protein
MKGPKKRWAPWKAALLAGGAVGVIGVALLVALIPARAADFDARMDRGTQGVAQLSLCIAAIAYIVQYLRVRKQIAPEVARTDATGEPVLAESSGMWIAGDRDLRPGRIDLTARRIVFYRANDRDGLAGTMLGLLQPRNGTTHRALDIDLASITRVQRGRFRATGKVLELSLADGTSHRVIVDRYDAFVSHLNARAGEILVDMTNAR